MCLMMRMHSFDCARNNIVLCPFLVFTDNRVYGLYKIATVSSLFLLGGGYKEMNNLWLCLLLILYSFELRSKLHSNFAHRDYGYAIVPMYYIVFTIHRDTGKCRRLDVCCRQAQIYKQCCFATLTNNKSHALASKLAGMAFIIRDHYVVTVYISEFGSLSLIFSSHTCKSHIEPYISILFRNICFDFVYLSISF
jgi:hypothetical protein